MTLISSLRLQSRWDWSLFSKNITMLRKAVFLLAFLFGLSANFFPANAQPNNGWVPAQTYRIGSNSVLKLIGKTNVNSFECRCGQVFAPQIFRIQNHDDGPHTTTFADTRLSIPITSLDCGNRLMNKDLQKSLNAERHPNISIELLEVVEDKCSSLRQTNEWVKVKALARISLNGYTNTYWLDITAKQSGPKRFRFIGTKALRMSDFCVEPPTAMMGMVKVEDEIKISLDLDITVD